MTGISGRKRCNEFGIQNIRNIQYFHWIYCIDKIYTSKVSGPGTIIYYNQKKYKIDSFKKLVFADKIKALNKYKEEEEKNLLGNDARIDSATVDWAIREVDENCMADVKLDDFILSAVGALR